VLQALPLAFWVVKALGAAHLLWLRFKAIRLHGLTAFAPAAHQPPFRILLTGLLSKVLNPKLGLFVLAFLPRLVSATCVSVATQMLVYRAIFAVVTAVIFSVVGA
jgi:threonine/homoserine/homoserine lactone efflux protein